MSENPLLVGSVDGKNFPNLEISLQRPLHPLEKTYHSKENLFEDIKKYSLEDKMSAFNFFQVKVGEDLLSAFYIDHTVSDEIDVMNISKIILSFLKKDYTFYIKNNPNKKQNQLSKIHNEFILKNSFFCTDFWKKQHLQAFRELQNTGCGKKYIISLNSKKPSDYIKNVKAIAKTLDEIFGFTLKSLVFSFKYFHGFSDSPGYVTNLVPLLNDRYNYLDNIEIFSMPFSKIVRNHYINIKNISFLINILNDEDNDLLCWSLDFSSNRHT